MNYKQLLLANNVDSAEDTGYGKDGKTELLQKTNPDDDIVPDIDLRLRLQEMEEINAQLEKLVNEQSKKMAEVVATNAKFLSIIAHDLKNPFSSIIGVLELLKGSYHDYNQTEVDRYIRMATNSANATLALLDNLLAWTSSQNNATFFDPVKLNLHELILEETENIIASATHKLITFKYSIDPKIYLAADLQMVNTIFRNLISNAIKFSYIGSEITISATEGRQFVEIIIEDNGIGITSKAKKELFKSNGIHSTKGTNNENGTGLGLLLCKEFVEKHGGTIRIESEPGKGSKVIFTLPHYI